MWCLRCDCHPQTMDSFRNLSVAFILHLIQDLQQHLSFLSSLGQKICRRKLQSRLLIKPSTLSIDSFHLKKKVFPNQSHLWRWIPCIDESKDHSTWFVEWNWWVNSDVISLYCKKTAPRGSFIAPQIIQISFPTDCQFCALSSFVACMIILKTCILQKRVRVTDEHPRKQQHDLVNNIRRNLESSTECGSSSAKIKREKMSPWWKRLP